jgi:predicted nucleic acid-binding protein
LSRQWGILGALIGETAIGLDAELATYNVKHYQALSDLKTVQPYKR